MAISQTDGWEAPLAPYPELGAGFGSWPSFDPVAVDGYSLESPVGADGSWAPLPVLSFPEADTYQGSATKATFTFSVPLPDQLGVLERWWADRIRNGIQDEARRQGVTPLVVAAWRDTTPYLHTNYTLTIIAAGASPVDPITLGAIIAIGVLVLLGIWGVKPLLKSFENILIGTGGAPAQFIPEGAPAPPGTIGPDGQPVPPGTPVKPGSYIPPKAAKPGLLDTVGSLAPLALLFLLVSSFKKGQ